MIRGFRTMLAAAGATIAGVTGLAAPAQATVYPTTTFTVPYGNSYATGVITWYNRNVNLSGSVKATAGNCRSMFASTWASTGQLGVSPKGEGYNCDGTSVSTYVAFDFGISADKPGGAAFVRVCLIGKPMEGPIGPADLPTLTCQNIER